MEKIELVNTHNKGGKGSGNFGHVGRPGQVGGAGSGGGTAHAVSSGTVSVAAREKLDRLGASLATMSAQGKMEAACLVENESGDYVSKWEGTPARVIIDLPTGADYGIKTHTLLHNHVKKYGSSFSPADVKILARKNITRLELVLFDGTRFTIERGKANPDTFIKAANTLNAFRDDAFNKKVKGKSADEIIKLWTAETHERNKTVASQFGYKYKKDKVPIVKKSIEEMGGKGTGNFGHAGRQGQRGGSTTGKFGSGRVAMMLRAAKEGGFTVDYSHMKSVVSGFAVGEFPEKSLSINARKINRDKIQGWLDSNKNMFKEDSSLKVGGWLDKETGKIWLDIIKVYPKGQKQRAINSGRKHRQIAITDLDAITRGDFGTAFINTGGTGY